MFILNEGTNLFRRGVDPNYLELLLLQHVEDYLPTIRVRKFYIGVFE